jgi:polyphenol oxidase
MIHLQFPTNLSIVNICILGKKEIPDRCHTNSEYIEIVNHYTKISHKNIYLLDQVHGDNFIDPVTYSTSVGSFPQADAMYTNQKGKVLVIKTADCMPVFLWDKHGSFISAIHSGWKGTYLHITTKVFQHLIQKYDSSTENVSARDAGGKSYTIYLGPSIRKTNYQVKEDVARFFTGYPNALVEKIGDSYYLSLDEILQFQLSKYPIDWQVSNHDTYRSAEYHSHRSGSLGRNLNVIYFK